MNRTTRLAVVPAIVLACGIGGTAGAADVYNACFKLSGSGVNKIRPSSVLVNQTPLCKPTETLHTWNEEGLQGPPGPPGITSCAPEEITGTCLPNTFAVLNFSCSNGGKAVGASAIWHTPFDAADNGPFYILPRDQDTWTFVPYNHTGTQHDFRAFLQCCN